MTINESAPNVPQPIDPAERIAFAVLADYFNEKHVNRAAFAEQCRTDDPDTYPEQMAIADTWRRAANVVSAIAHSHPGGPETSWKLTIKIGASELGKLIAMATARQESPANECSNSERTQYELTIAQQQSKIAELMANIEQMENANLRTAPYIEEKLATIEQQKEKITDLEKQLADEVDNPLTTEIESDDVRAVIAERDELLQRVTELESRIDELTKVPVVDVAAALQRVRQCVVNLTCKYAVGTCNPVFVLEAIDAELAALTLAKSPTTP